MERLSCCRTEFSTNAFLSIWTSIQSLSSIWRNPRAPVWLTTTSCSRLMAGRSEWRGPSSAWLLTRPFTWPLADLAGRQSGPFASSLCVTSSPPKLISRTFHHFYTVKANALSSAVKHESQQQESGSFELNTNRRHELSWHPSGVWEILSPWRPERGEARIS